MFSSPNSKRPVLRETEAVPILPPHFLPLALPTFRASESGFVLPENYNGEEFVHCTIEAKKKETTLSVVLCEDHEPVFLCLGRRTIMTQITKQLRSILKKNQTKTKHGRVSWLKPMHSGACFTVA